MWTRCVHGFGIHLCIGSVCCWMEKRNHVWERGDQSGGRRGGVSVDACRFLKMGFSHSASEREAEDA